MEADRVRVSRMEGWRPRGELVLQFRSEGCLLAELPLVLGRSVICSVHAPLHFGGAVCFTQSPLFVFWDSLRIKLRLTSSWWSTCLSFSSAGIHLLKMLISCKSTLTETSRIAFDRIYDYSGHFKLTLDFECFCVFCPFKSDVYSFISHIWICGLFLF